MMQFCAEPGCGVLVTVGRCPAHGGALERERGTARSRGYSRRWESTAAIFRTRYPLCGMRPDGKKPIMSQCADEGRITIAACVDHAIPHRGNHRLFWDQDNWQSLCAACHTRKTAAGL